VFFLAVVLCVVKYRAATPRYEYMPLDIPEAKYRHIGIIALLVVPPLFFIASYLPIYIWYISPRHQYLPSIAAATGAASLFSLLLWAAHSVGGRYAVQITGCLLAAVVSLAAYTFALATFVEKDAWITSYQARKALYQDLMKQPAFREATTFLFEGTPTFTPFGSAFFGYQQAGEVEFFTRGRKRMDHLVRDSQPSHTGEYIFVEAGVWGEDAFRHVPKEKVFHLRYQNLEGYKIGYRPVSHIFNPNHYSIQPASGPDDGHFSARWKEDTGDTGLLIHLPTVQLKTDEVVTLLPLIPNGPALQPLTVGTWSGTGTGGKLLLIDPPPNGGEQQTVFLRLAASLSKPVAMRLYITDGKGHRLVSEIPIAAE
jgi:hypothetical protein